MNAEEKNNLKKEITELIIEVLKITHVTAAEVPSNAPLFGQDNPLGLDSIDAIEIILAVQQKYNVRIADQNLARVILESIDTIADFLEKELDNVEK
ncbi:MAG: acyl carrier protein [Bacteroidetes bacterium]|nr:acyl carrier protein [Bacteroidota bacterium]